MSLPPSTNTPTEQEAQLHYRWSKHFIEDDGFRRRLLLVMLFISVPIVLSLAVIADSLPLMEFDLNTTTNLQAIQLELFREVMLAVSFLGFQPYATIMVAGVAVVVGLWLGWKEAFFLGTTVVAQGGLNVLIKTVVARPRPLDTVVEVVQAVSGNSFPSGHVMFYTVFFGFLFFLVTLQMPRSWLKTGLLVVLGTLVVLIGPSRIYVGAHWLSDVIAAYLIGVVLLLISIELYLRYLVAPPDKPTSVL
jgi:membrane-associated phospholipid phosphatase